MQNYVNISCGEKRENFNIFAYIAVEKEQCSVSNFIVITMYTNTYSIYLSILYSIAKCLSTAKNIKEKTQLQSYWELCAESCKSAIVIVCCCMEAI